FEAELVPALAAILAAQEAERVDETGTGRRVTAAVEMLRGRCEAHVVVLRPGRFRPFAVVVNREAKVAGNHEPLAVAAVRESMHVYQRHLCGGRAADCYQAEDQC